MSDPELSAELLLLLVVANGAPIVAWKLFSPHFAWPLDSGCRAPDGHRWLGDAKTWRGLVAGVGATIVAAWVLGYPSLLGAGFGMLAMVGDLVSSFIKRRLALPSSSRATGLDQLPEAVLPLLVLRESLALAWGDLLVVVVLFVVLELVLSRLLYRLRIRRRPY